MKTKDLFRKCNVAFRQAPETFENKLLYAELINPYSDYVDSKWGYLDGAKEVLETHKSIEELEKYIKQFEIDNKPLCEYEHAYVSAYHDYIKQEKTKKVAEGEHI